MQNFKEHSGKKEPGCFSNLKENSFFAPKLSADE
jgi:hypothetical protein